MASYLPTREADLVTWTANFLAIAGPNATACGLELDQIATYQTAQEDFAAAYAASQNPSTRTPGAIETKNDLKTALIALTRQYVNICQASPAMTNTLRVDLGITVRDTDPTPVPVPSESPTIDVTSVKDFTIQLRLHNGDSTRRAKPEGVIGATLFSFVGDAPPTDLAAWKFEGNVSQTITSVTVPNTTVSGSKVWLTAFWFNRKSESGPATTPIATIIQGGGVTMNKAA